MFKFNQKNKVNTLVNQTFTYTFSSLLNSLIPFFLIPIFTNYLTPEEYGLVSMFKPIILIVFPFVGLSVNGAITRFYYDKDNLDIWEFIYNTVLILVFSTLIVALFFLFFSDYISQLTFFPSNLLWLVILFSFSQFINNILLSLYQVQKKSFSYSLFLLGKSFAIFLITVLLVVVLNIGWIGAIYGQVISVSFFSLIAFVILIRKKWIKFKKPNKKLINLALLFGLPLIFHSLSNSIITFTDRIFIANMVDLSTAGIYTLGYQIGSIINLFALAFNNAYVPWLFEKLNLNLQSVKYKIVKFTYLYFFGIVLLALIVSFLAPPLLGEFLGESYQGSYIYVIWISLGYAFNGMYFMVVNFLFYTKNTVILAIITFTSALLNIILNYILISLYGGIGAAIATTIIFLLKFISVWLFSSLKYKMPWNLIKHS